jgi:hypothetical protein
MKSSPLLTGLFSITLAVSGASGNDGAKAPKQYSGDGMLRVRAMALGRSAGTPARWGPDGEVRATNPTAAGGRQGAGDIAKWDGIAMDSHDYGRSLGAVRSARRESNWGMIEDGAAV